MQALPWQPVQPRPGFSRREWLRRSGGGAGMLALASLLGARRGLGSGPHFAPKAKSVIWCFMYGGPSGIDLFDRKPGLDRSDGKSFSGATGLKTFSGKVGPLMKSPFAFAPHGQSGREVSEICPGIAQHVDRIAFLNSCHVETNVHDQALFQVNTGLTRLGFPSAGSWVTYGLGTENENLPGFVVMYDPRGIPVGGSPLWSSGFLPRTHGGTVFRTGDSPVLNLERPGILSPAARRRQLDLVLAMHRDHLEERPGDRHIAERIQSFELAYRMQMEAPEAVDLTQEPDEIRRLYGMDVPESRTFGAQLLMARRLVERGVRFVQVYSGGINSEWDSHSKLEENHRARALETDIPVAGLLTDLGSSGLLDETLVIWGGEFGRMPFTEGGGGRDHNPHGFLMWMAGGGIKGGISHGQTDEIGFRAVSDPVSVHDLHATVLHLLGIDHTRLTYRHDGRDFRLTDVAGEVIHDVLA